MLIDTHFHLDFCPGFSLLPDVPVVAQTLSPHGFSIHPPTRFLSLGLHPWYATKEAIAEFPRYAESARLIGEVGLDFARGTACQVEAFARVLECVQPGSVLSIHAVRAVTAVLDMLESRPDVTRIIHWFSGTSDELTRHIRAGGFISVNPRMLATKRGRAYVKQVPGDRLLVETDLPAHGETITPAEHARILTATLDGISDLRGEDMRPQIEKTQEAIYL